jgi:hypothetical protein
MHVLLDCKTLCHWNAFMQLQQTPIALHRGDFDDFTWMGF